MSISDPVKPPPSIRVDQKVDQVGPGGEVVGVKVGTLVSVYVFGAPGTTTPPRRPADAEPYLFLDSFTFDDQPIFFGREKLTEELRSVILGHATTTLIGKAAVGKTSLINAGLIPALARDGNTIALTIRDYAKPAAGVRE